MAVTHPKAEELAGAIAGFMARLVPILPPRESFMARVAQNALGILQREIAQGPAADAAARERLAGVLGRDGTLPELTAALCERIRNGELDAASPGLLAALKANTLDQLAIDQPDYRWRASGRH
jgi:hypothetical protein